MPIQFRCQHCGQLLSISRKKAGAEVTCPQCVHRVTVPALEQPNRENHEDSAQPQLAREEQVLASAAAADAWQDQPDPWRNEEDGEEDEFQLSSPALEESGLDMTPMVDVTFLLLIFFMITASFSMQKSMETTPPDPNSDAASQSMVIEDLEENSVVVEIDEEDRIRVDDVPVSGIGELTDVLAAKISNEAKTEMLIEAHPAATHGRVVAVTDAGIEVRMQRIRRTSKKQDD